MLVVPVDDKFGSVPHPARNTARITNASADLFVIFFPLQRNARYADVKRVRANQMVDRVIDAVRRWPEFAEKRASSMRL